MNNKYEIQKCPECHTRNKKYILWHGSTSSLKPKNPNSFFCKRCKYLYSLCTECGYLLTEDEESLCGLCFLEYVQRIFKDTPKLRPKDEYKITVNLKQAREYRDTGRITKGKTNG